MFYEVPAFDEMSHEVLTKYVKGVLGLRRSENRANSAEEVEDESGKKISDQSQEGLNGYLLLNYHWQKHMGDFTFNEETFPDVNRTLNYVRLGDPRGKVLKSISKVAQHDYFSGRLA